MKLRSGYVKLERAFSKLGYASRKVAQELILQGHVTVDGKLVKDPSFLVRPEIAKIEIRQNKIEIAEKMYFLFHKPRGVVTTRKDEKGRKTVFDYFKSYSCYLHAVGRLDFATSGLLLLTNDTGFSAYYTDPKNEIERKYIVTVRGRFTNEKLEFAVQGLNTGGETLSAKSIEILKVSGKETKMKVTLVEGKNREIRRLFQALGHEVTKLKRISFGIFELGDLEVGEVRKVIFD